MYLFINSSTPILYLLNMYSHYSNFKNKEYLKNMHPNS